MEKIIIGIGYGSYSFNAALKQVTISGVTTVTIEQFLLIVNVTQDTVIYNPTCFDLGGTLSGSVLTLDYDTTLFNNTDDLQIHFALNTTTDNTPSLLATEATLQDVLTALQDIEINADNINLNTDQLEAKVDTTNTTLTNGTQITKITDGAGTVNTKQLGTAITSSDVGLVTNSVIHGKTTGGGGGYVDVKVSPSGALVTDTTISGTVPVTDNGGSLTVDGTVNVGNFPATQNVAITSSVEVEVKNDSGSPIPISGTVTANTGLSQPLTDTELRASAVPISGTVTITPSGTQTITGSVSVSNFPATQPVSAASLPLPTGAATSSEQTTSNNYLAALNSLTPTQYDYIDCSYTSGNLTGVVYKSGGSVGTTVSTLTLTYDVNNNLTSVTKT